MQVLAGVLEAEGHHQAIQVSCAHHYGCSTSNFRNLERLHGISQKVHSEADYVDIFKHSTEVQVVDIGMQGAYCWG